MTAEVADLNAQIAAMVRSMADDAAVVLPKTWVQHLLDAAELRGRPDWTSAAELGRIIGLKPQWLVRHAGDLPFARRVPGSRRILFQVSGALSWMTTRAHP